MQSFILHPIVCFQIFRLIVIRIFDYLLLFVEISNVFIKKLDENAVVWQFFPNFVARNRRGLCAESINVE